MSIRRRLSLKFIFRSCTILLAGLLVVCLPAAAQSQTQAPPKVTAHDSVEVRANLSPEEVEDWKINELYQKIYSAQQKSACTVEIVQRYESEVIPVAEKSSFKVPKNKFLFLANREIGNCFLAQKRYPEAEERFKKTLEYLPVWPGMTDSDYPISFQEIGIAQMAQEHWEAAEESLKKSASIFDPLVEKAIKANDDFSQQYAGNVCGLKARTLVFLAIVEFRQGHMPEALNEAELAYQEANRPHVPAYFLDEVVKVGVSIAGQSGDDASVEKWSKRAPH